MEVVRRALLALGFLVGVPATIAAVASCMTEPPSTSYGNPNTLARSNIPGEAGVEALTCGGGEGGSGTPKEFEGGAPSFALDIYPAYFAPGTGAWHCGDKTCHGGTTDPTIDTSTADKCLASLQKATVTGKLLVTADGGKDPNQDGLLCNLQGQCGSKMPQPPGKDPTEEDLCLIQQWLAAGAPK